jgi:hypothetical protein
MKKTVVSTILFIIILLPAFSQRTKDVLYLKNGSMIFGKMMEVSDSIYKIRTAEGSLFIFKAPEVEKFVNETPLYNGRKKNGVGLVLEAGFLAGVKTSEYSTPFSFNILADVTYRTKDIFGIGSGVEFIGQSYTPVFAEYKHLFSENKTSPFVFFRGGKLFHNSGDIESSDITINPYNYPKTYKGGSSFTLGTGVSWDSGDNETYLSFAYRNAHTSYTQNDYNKQLVTYKSTINRLEVKLGFRF